MCLCVCGSVEGQSRRALAFESQVTALLFHGSPLVFIILIPYQVQGTQPHAWARTPGRGTGRTVQVFKKTKKAL